jgi:transposase-like protein
MAQHFSRSKAFRDLTSEDMKHLTERSAWELFCKVRWGSLTNVRCPTCNQIDKHYHIASRKQWRCKHCGHVFSVTSDTPFANRRLSFLKLIELIYAYAQAPKGLSANEICGKIGITHRTAWQNLHKIREATFHAQDRVKLTGYVQIDGCHVCGKPRRGRKRVKMTSDIVNNHLKNRKANIVPNRSPVEVWNIEKLKNRRIVLALRQIGEKSGDGGIRTITCILKAESPTEVIQAIKKYVALGTIIHTDDGKAFSSLNSLGYRHKTVRHSVEYSTDDGVNNNQAEAFFSRLRRAEYGTYHGMRPQYLAFYAAELGWRDDCRKNTMKKKFTSLFGRVLGADISFAFRGYCQGRRLPFEYLG